MYANHATCSESSILVDIVYMYTGNLNLVCACCYRVMVLWNHCNHWCSVCTGALREVPKLRKRNLLLQRRLSEANSQCAETHKAKEFALQSAAQSEARALKATAKLTDLEKTVAALHAEGT